MICPCCGHEFQFAKTQAERELGGIRAGKTVAGAIALLSVKYPDVAPYALIPRAIWGDNQPSCSNHSICVVMYRARCAVSRYGWTIDCVKDEGYKLRKLDGEKDAAEMCKIAVDK